MSSSYILRVVGEGGAARRPAADYSGKQESTDYSSNRIEEVGEPFLFNPLY